MKKIKITLAVLLTICSAMVLASMSSTEPIGKNEGAPVFGEKKSGVLEITMSFEEVKATYSETITGHFVNFAERQGLDPKVFDVESVDLSNMDFIEGKKLSYMTFDASSNGLNIIVAIPVFNGIDDSKFYLNKSDVGIPDGEVEDYFLECPCESHLCVGIGCEGCSFVKNGGDCITGCDCHDGGGTCDHSITSLPPTACIPN